MPGFSFLENDFEPGNLADGAEMMRRKKFPDSGSRPKKKFGMVAASKLLKIAQEKPKTALEQRIEKGIGPVVLTIDGMNYRDDTVCVCGHWYGAHGINSTRCKGFRCGCYSFRWLGNSVADKGVLRDALPKCPICQNPVVAKLVDVDDRFVTTSWIHRNPITDAPGAVTVHAASAPLPLKMQTNDNGDEVPGSLPILLVPIDDDDSDDDFEEPEEWRGPAPRKYTAAGTNGELVTSEPNKLERTKFDEAVQRGEAPRASIRPGEEV